MARKNWMLQEQRRRKERYPRVTAQETKQRKTDKRLWMKGENEREEQKQSKNSALQEANSALQKGMFSQFEPLQPHTTNMLTVLYWDLKQWTNAQPYVTIKKENNRRLVKTFTCLNLKSLACICIKLFSSIYLQY